jgi:hypothetical protein
VNLQCEPCSCRTSRLRPSLRTKSAQSRLPALTQFTPALVAPAGELEELGLRRRSSQQGSISGADMPSAPRTEAPSRLACPDGWMVLYDVETTGESTSSHIVDIYMIAIHVPSGRMREVGMAPAQGSGLDCLVVLTSWVWRSGEA